MPHTYFKRYRMEFDLCRRLPPPPQVAESFRFLPWRKSLLREHAETKFLSFKAEIDANVFPCLGDYEGCLRLMNEIVQKPGFLPEATWLVRYYVPGEVAFEGCGTIQGIRDSAGFGSVQNLGVTPQYRGRGLGAALLFQAMAGFQEAGLRRAFLEVTAQNVGAVRLYERFGFHTVKTLYKASETALV